MGRTSIAALVLGFAGLAWAGAAHAESDPLKDAGVARVRDSFKVDGIALFDPHATHAPRMGICAASIFAGLKWCVSGAIEEKAGEAAFIKTTGYNINADNRIVYAISSRRSYPLKRAEFDGIVHAIGERYGIGATLLAFKKTTEDAGSVDSLIAVWGGVRLVHLSEAEYALVESGGSLKRGHLVDHRFNLVVSAKQRDPIYKIEGEAGYILHLTATSPDRADVIARAIYPPVFQPPPAKPSSEAPSPLVGETVRRSTTAAPAERAPGNSAATAEEQARRIEAERGLAAERLLREEAERKAAEAERKGADERRAFEEEKKRLETELKAAEERAKRAGLSADERKRAEEADRKQAEARRADLEKKVQEERRRKEEAERRAAEEQAARAAAERKAVEEKRRKDEAERKAAEEKTARAAAERQAADERRRRDEADRKSAEERAKRSDEERRADAERRAADERREQERKRAQEESERAAEESRRSADDQGSAEGRAIAERLARERAQRPESWKKRAAAAAKDAGAIWSFTETQDRVADERTLRSQTVFAGPQAGEKARLAIEVTFECTISGRDRRLLALARGFDRGSGVRVAFRADGDGSFGVRTRFMLDDQVPQSGLLFRERQEDTASILEVPVTSADLGNKAPRAALWLRYYAVIVEFHLVNGTVTATIAPQADNLRRVLEACAQ